MRIVLSDSFSIETKYGSDFKVWSKIVMSQYPNDNEIKEKVLCFETLNGYPAMLTEKEIKALIAWLLSYLGEK